ncbi:MAG TPA: TIGR04211 family SH3 domain-containing protein [Chromatiales bacterium]|nr:TIGR04211 family SH3 domain-containing protein [Chromatiales bacterium]
MPAVGLLLVRNAAARQVAEIHRHQGQDAGRDERQEPGEEGEGRGNAGGIHSSILNVLYPGNISRYITKLVHNAQNLSARNLYYNPPRGTTLQKPHDEMRIGQERNGNFARRGLPWLWLLAVWLSPFSPAVGESAISTPGEYLYVDDVIYINLRSGPDTQSPTLKVIKSGTRLKLLERDESKGVSRVALDSGEEGWVLNRFVSTMPIAQDLLDAANEKIVLLEEDTRRLKENVRRLQMERDKGLEEAAALEKEKQRLARELREIKAISGSAVETLEQNRALRLEKEQQNKKLKEMESRYAALSTQVYTIGIGAALVSLALGIYIGYTPTRRQNRWRRVG